MTHTVETDSSSSSIQNLTQKLRDFLGTTLEQIQRLQRSPINIDCAEELSALRFRAGRLAHRLHAMEQDGLFVLEAKQHCCPMKAIRKAVEEVEGECSRRGIGLFSEEPVVPVRTWVDEDHLLEALRCFLDAALESTGIERITIESTLRSERMELSLVLDGMPSDFTSIHMQVGTELLHQMGSELKTRHDENSVRLEFAISLASRPSVAPVSNFNWVFPTPTAA